MRADRITDAGPRMLPILGMVRCAGSGSGGSTLVVTVMSTRMGIVPTERTCLFARERAHCNFATAGGVGQNLLCDERPEGVRKFCGKSQGMYALAGPKDTRPR